MEYLTICQGIIKTLLTFNVLGYVAIIVALVSLTISAITLFLSVIKKGRPVISIIKNGYTSTLRETEPNKSTGISETFSTNLIFPILIKNSGANETAYSQLAWEVDGNYNSYNITVEYNKTREEFMKVVVLKPYEHKIENIVLYICIEYINIDQLKKDRIKIRSEYNWYKKDTVKKITKYSDLTNTLVKEFMKGHNFDKRE